VERWSVLLRRIFPLLLVALIVAWGAWYVASHSEELEEVESIAPGWLLLLLTLATIKIGCMGLFTKFVVSALGIELGFVEWFGITAMSAMANYLTPFRGGAAVRAVYLKLHHGLPYSFFVSTLSALYLLSFATSAVLGLLAEVTLRLRYGVSDTSTVVFSIIVLLLPVVLFALARWAPRLSEQRTNETATRGSSGWPARVVHRGVEIARQVVEGWRLISSKPAKLLWLVCASLLNAGVTLLMIHTAFVAVGVRLPLLESLVLSSLFMISSLIPLTPSGLGVAEIAVVMASQDLGVRGPLGVLSAGLNRTVMILISILWGTLFTYVLSRRAVVVPPQGDEGD